MYPPPTSNPSKALFMFNVPRVQYDSSVQKSETLRRELTIPTMVYGSVVDKNTTMVYGSGVDDL